jgi:hypothetical protein
MWPTRGAAVAALLAISLYAVLGPSLRPSSRIPPHLLGHPVHYYPNLLSPATRAALMNLTRALGALPGVTSAEASYAMTHEHIGEGRDHPVGPDGGCAHAFLAPSSDGRSCILPGRIDVGKHYIATGGTEALRDYPRNGHSTT